MPASDGREFVPFSYMRDARSAEKIYAQLDRVLNGSFRHLPVTTIFRERNDPLGFQPQSAWDNRANRHKLLP